jgi:HAD superfamily hydrolase (TIGR01549 family)
VLDDEDLRMHWGKPLSVMMSILYDTQDIDKAMAYNKKHHSQFPKLIHEDTLKVLRTLRKKGKKLGVITATNRFSFEYDLRTLGIPPKLFDYIQTEEDSRFHKPDPRVFEPTRRWLESLSVEPSQTLYVGDALHDMKAAVGAGFMFVGVATGLVTKKQFIEDGAMAITKLSDLLGKEDR